MVIGLVRPAARVVAAEAVAAAAAADKPTSPESLSRPGKSE
jgi:hypothetical protein